MDQNLYQISKIPFSILFPGNKPPIKIYINKIHNAVKFNIKSKYYLEILIAESMEFLDGFHILLLQINHFMIYQRFHNQALYS